MNRYIYFVRHAQPDLTVHEDAIRPLTAPGHQQSEQLAEIFKDKDITAIYSSPYLRCRQTAKPTADLLNLTIQEHPGLIERKVSNGWIADFNEFAMKQWADFNYRLEDGESLNETKSRSIKALDEIIHATEGNIIIFGHGTSLSTIFHHYDDSYNHARFKDLKMPDVYRLILPKRTISRYAYETN